MDIQGIAYDPRGVWALAVDIGGTQMSATVVNKNKDISIIARGVIKTLPERGVEETCRTLYCDIVSRT